MGLRRFCRPFLEQLETREVPAAAVSGTVFHTFDVAGLFPAQGGPAFLKPLANVTVNLDGGTQTTMTNMDGEYSFATVAEGTHTVAVVPPAGFIGFSAQSLSVNIVIGATEMAYPNLNFALTTRSEALVQNLYELVLQRPADDDGFLNLVQQRDGGASVGALFVSLFDSFEFSSVVKPIANLVTTFFAGPTDIGLLRNAVQNENLGISQDAAVLEILYSQEFVAAFGDTSQLTDTQFVTFLYQNLLNRLPKNAELNQWVNPLVNKTMNRGEVTLGILNLPEFAQVKANVARKVAVSLAFLGVLGREATPAELTTWTNKLAGGMTVKQLATQLSKKAEFTNLTGFTDTFIWDVQAHQIEPAINVLDRLQIYNPVTQAFDIPVTSNLITSTMANPTNVYAFAHGWSPGFLEAVYLESTPGDPLKSWETANYPTPPGAVAAYLYKGVNQISAQGLAQAIHDRDPNALVVAFSWVDQSATLQSDSQVQVQRVGKLTTGSPVVKKLADTTQLSVGMPVTGPGIPANTVIASIDSSSQVTLSANATETASSAPLAFLGIVLTGSTNGTTTMTVSDSSRLIAGMLVTGPGLAAGTTVAGITGPGMITLSQAATGTFTNQRYVITGEDATLQLKQTAYAGRSEAYTQVNGLRLAAGITNALNPNFFPNQGLIHLLGHSHGSKVATVAALALQKNGVPVTQLSLFESPEAGPNTTFGDLHGAGLGGAQNFLWYYLAQMELARTPVTGRMPNSGTFVDNYYSNEGFGTAFGGFSGLNNFGTGFNANLNSVVDVLFHPEDLYGSLSPTDLTGGLTALFGSHGYPPPWYAQASLGTDYGLNWSPLLGDGNAAGLDQFYEQQQQPTPGQFVQTQFELNGSPMRPTSINYAPPAPVALEYAQQYTQGNVTDTGSAITLSVDAANPTALDVITFNPLAVNQQAGTGLDFSVQFSGVDPGEQVELVIWIRGMASVPQALGGAAIFGNTIGYLSIPLFAMSGLDAGTGAMLATISLDGFRGEAVLDGPFNSLAGGPIIPTLGFSLITPTNSNASVTVTNLRQFRDGVS